MRWWLWASCFRSFHRHTKSFRRRILCSFRCHHAWRCLPLNLFIYQWEPNDVVIRVRKVFNQSISLVINESHAFILNFILLFKFRVWPKLALTQILLLSINILMDLFELEQNAWVSCQLCYYTCRKRVKQNIALSWSERETFADQRLGFLVLICKFDEELSCYFTSGLVLMRKKTKNSLKSFSF